MQLSSRNSTPLACPGLPSRVTAPPRQRLSTASLPARPADQNARCAAVRGIPRPELAGRAIRRPQGRQTALQRGLLLRCPNERASLPLGSTPRRRGLQAPCRCTPLTRLILRLCSSPPRNRGASRPDGDANAQRGDCRRRRRAARPEATEARARPGRRARPRTRTGEAAGQRQRERRCALRRGACGPPGVGRQKRLRAPRPCTLALNRNCAAYPPSPEQSAPCRPRTESPPAPPAVPPSPRPSQAGLPRASLRAKLPGSSSRSSCSRGSTCSCPWALRRPRSRASPGRGRRPAPIRCSSSPRPCRSSPPCCSATRRRKPTRSRYPP